MTLEEKIAKYFWWHTIELGDGVVTPGVKSLELMRLEADKLFSRVDLRGKSVLDVGAWNGGFSLEAARRGATRVAGLDHLTWNEPGLFGRETFDLVSELTNSHFEAIDLDLDAPGLSLKHLGQFDVVLYSGVFYHLIDPIAATREIAALAREALVLETYIEGTCEERPAMVFFPGAELNNDASNWWGPNVACIRALLRQFGFPHIEVTDGSDAWRKVFHAFRS
jgi:tRNA (mo5U34)-methyltransferase